MTGAVTPPAPEAMPFTNNYQRLKLTGGWINKSVCCVVGDCLTTLPLARTPTCEKFGGNVFVVFSEKEKIKNEEVIAQIATEIELLSR
jgi:hypothetical protein